MKKKIYLTPSEQNIFSVLSSRHTIDIGELQGIFPEISPLSLNKTLSSLAKKGYLYRIQKGVYILSRSPSQTPEIYDPMQVALTICSGYIGFLSALRVYELITYEPFTVFVITKKRSKIITVGEYTLQCVAMGKRCTDMWYYKGVYVSTLEKTFFDCFYKPQHAGGYAVITSALYQVSSFDWNLFCSYFSNESFSLFQRTGYILESLNNHTGIIPDTVISYFRQYIKNNARLIPSGPGSGTYIPSWKIIDNIGAEQIFSWWTHG